MQNLPPGFPGMPPMPGMTPPPPPPSGNAGAAPGGPGGGMVGMLPPGSNGLPQLTPQMIQQMMGGCGGPGGLPGMGGQFPSTGMGGMSMPQLMGAGARPTVPPPPPKGPDSNNNNPAAPRPPQMGQGGGMPGMNAGQQQQQQQMLQQMQQMQQMQMQHMQQQQQQMQQQQQQQQPQPPPPQSQPQPPPPQSKPSQPPPPPPQQEKIDIQAQMAELEKMKCPLHAKKPKAVCRMCKTYKDMLDKIQAQGESKKSSGGGSSAKGGSFAESDRSGPLELANPKNYGFAGLLQTHITESAHYKSLNEIETIEALVDETYQYANSIEPYMPNSNTIPSGLFVCLYKFFTMNLDGQSLKRLMNSQESPFIRCCGFLYVRMGLPHDQILGWLGEYLLDDEEFKPAPDSEGKITIGEFVESILSQDKYYSTVLPRLPMSTKRHVEEKLAALGQNRKRMQANKGIIEVFRESNVRIECLIGGEWLPATVIELDDDPPNRPKVRAKLEDGTEEYVHLGLVIVVDSKVKQVSRRRSRSRSRHDWSREKGRSDKELVEELRSKDRDRAVCTNGKTYAKKPLGYKAQCALPREQGKAATKLMEEETTVHVSRKSSRRSPSPRQEAFGKRPSAEHQARMQQLFEKYGNQARMESGGAGGSDMLDRADVMRLG